MSIDLGIGDAIAGGLNYLGQRSANRTNVKLSREQMKFQQASNREQMAFQERMSNTSYQRARADMEAAGINPILAAGAQSSSPSGSSSSGSMARVENEMSGALSSALQVKMMREQIKVMDVNAKATQAVTESTTLDNRQKSFLVNLMDENPKMAKAMAWLKMLSPAVSTAKDVSGIAKALIL